MVVFIDPQIAGISGDMILSALVSIGANKSKIIDGIHTIENYINSNIKYIDFDKIIKHGISATKMTLDYSDITHKRKGIEIKKSIESVSNKIGLSEKAIVFSHNAIDTIILAESKIHGIPMDSVYLHEASGIDTIVDIIGTAIALDDLNFINDKIITAPVAVGGGTVTFSHGVTTNPANAILEIFKNTEIPIFGGSIKGELTTPTGASLLTSMTKSCLEYYPFMKIKSVGYGAGEKDFSGFSNVLKIVYGEPIHNLERNFVKIIETNVDNISGEIIGDTIEKIMMCGAKDITITPALTKKGRPTNIISVICDSTSINTILNLLITETETLGVRIRTSERLVLHRKNIVVPIIIDGKKFKIHCKTSPYNNYFKIEHDDIKQISNNINKSLIYTEQLVKNMVNKNLK